MVKGIATLVGVIGSAMTIQSQYNASPAADVGAKLLFAMAGYDATPNGKNDFEHVSRRLIVTYGPAVAGKAVSMAAARTGVNRSLPKGVNL